MPPLPQSLLYLLLFLPLAVFFLLHPSLHFFFFYKHCPLCPLLHLLSFQGVGVTHICSFQAGWKRLYALDSGDLVVFSQADQMSHMYTQMPGGDARLDEIAVCSGNVIVCLSAPPLITQNSLTPPHPT